MSRNLFRFEILFNFSKKISKPPFFIYFNILKLGFWLDKILYTKIDFRIIHQNCNCSIKPIYKKVKFVNNCLPLMICFLATNEMQNINVASRMSLLEQRNCSISKAKSLVEEKVHLAIEIRRFDPSIRQAIEPFFVEGYSTVIR